jgi:hypothetical protein
LDEDGLLAFYAAPGVFTGVDLAAADAPPPEPGAVAAFVQGLLMHEGLPHLYGFAAPDSRRADKQLHAASAMLSRAGRLSAEPLSQPRPPEQRVLCVCRHFATLFTALMRRAGVPARARCGFATYFAPGKRLDHWVGEYWDARARRWRLVDAQIDPIQQQAFAVDFDPLDVPRDRFLVGGDAWRACRAGADPLTFGVGGTQMWGLVEVYGDLFQDLAALQKIELLPWGWYGLALDEAGMGETSLLDDLAAISSHADATALTRLRALLAGDERLRIPDAAVRTASQADALALAGGP